MSAETRDKLDRERARLEMKRIFLEDLGPAAAFQIGGIDHTLTSIKRALNFGASEAELQELLEDARNIR